MLRSFICLLGAIHLAAWTGSALSQSPLWRTLPGPEGGPRMDDVFFINSSIGWGLLGICSGWGCTSGDIWKTTDGGQTWALQYSTWGYPRSVGFVDSLTGWVGTLGPDSNHVLYQTTNGGTTWSLVDNIPPPRPRGICGISVVNDSVMYASGKYTGPARMIKTTNRGATWTSIDLSAHAGALVDCYFFSPDSGFVVGSSSSSYDTGYTRVLFTSDGGNTWVTRHSSNRSGELCWKIQFRTRTTGYVSIEKFSQGPTYYLKTTDGGITWSDQLFRDSRYRVQGIGFVNDSLGWLGGWMGDTYETTDGGTSWHLAGFGSIINRFRILNDTLAYAVGATVYKFSIDSVTSNWTLQSSGTTNTLTSVSFTNANTGMTVGWGDSTILRTTNGGGTWTSQVSGTTNYLSSVSFTDANTGTAVGYDGTILRTTNGGTSWTSQPSGTTNWLQGVSFIDASTGTVVGYDGTILRTTNGGATWTLQPSGTTNSLWGVSFTDANTGTVVGSHGTILRTTTGGVTWMLQSSGTNAELGAVSFTDANTGTVVGEVGTILRTTNGGATWMLQSSGTNAWLGAISFTDANTGTAVGGYGTILRTTTGGTVWVREEPHGLKPRKFMLSQNYPNPFNPSTIIRYQLPVASYVTLKIYNVLGQEVATLVHEEMKPGRYEVTWAGSGFASGVYFYRLQAGSYTETKKLVLMR